MYKTEDCGLFVGFVTMPFGQEREFIDNEINWFFQNFKESLASYFGKSENEDQGTDNSAQEFQDYFYKPKCYCLFGSFDLAVISLVDDFNLSSRNFHPFNSYLEEDRRDGYQYQNYTFHVITGVAPDLRFNDKQERSLVERAKNTILASRENQGNFPFVGITSLKVNNGLLIGNGGILLELIVKALHNILKKEERSGVDYMIIHSFSWHEITILFFADDFRKISNIVLELRSMVFGDLEIYGTKKRFKKILEDCLVHDFLHLGENKEANDIKNSHLFVNTHTTFGYDIDILIAPEKYQDINTPEMEFYMRWFIKPGHLGTFINEFKATEDEADSKVIIGRGDYAYVFQKDITAMREIINKIIDKDLKKHIRKIYTVPALLQTPKDFKLVDDDRHFFFHNFLHHFCFPMPQLIELRNNLQKCRVSKAIREKIINMYVIYNDGINDPVLYGYFIELRPFLEKRIKDIDDYAKKKENDYDIQTVTGILVNISNRFEIAYRNRFGQSYIMSEITDYNIEFNGGIQQLLSAYDGANKSLNSLFGELYNNESFTYITSHSGLDSDQSSVRLNYFQLFQPEIFVSRATHNSALHFFKRWKSQFENEEKNKKDLEMIHYLENLPSDDLPEGFRYFFYDYLTYIIAYNSDFDLYNYWFWNNFMQVSLMYDKDGSVNENKFQQHLVRILLLAKMTDNHDKVERTIRAPCIQLQSLWESNISLLSSGTDIEINKFLVWLTDLKEMAHKQVKFDFLGRWEKKPEKEISENEFLVKLLQKHNIKHEWVNSFHYGRNIDYSMEELLNKRKEIMNYSADGIIKNLKKGSVYFPGSWREDTRLLENIDCSYSFHYHILFYSYLKLTKELAGKGNSVVFRTEEGAPEIHGSKGKDMEKVFREEADLMFDPFGGVFSVNSAVRRKHLKYRAVFLMMVWTLSQRYKKKLFTDI